MNSIGERLECAIKTLGLKKNEFAEIVERSTGNISDWINNKCKPSKKGLTLINTRLGLSIEWILTGKGDMFDVSFSKESTINTPSNLTLSFSQPPSDLDEETSMLIDIFSQLSRLNKGRLLEKAETLLETQQTKKQKSHPYQAQSGEEAATLTKDLA